MSYLNQPILSTQPEPGHELKDVLTLEQMIALFKEEEDYWGDDKYNTKLIISKLRKIFYDKWGWNKELIRGAANVETRYQTEVVETKPEFGKPISKRKKYITTAVYRVITYTNHDKVYGASRVGQVPFIYQNDHQEIRLPDGNMCDIAHILAGLDAYNNFTIVTPLPNWLKFLYPLLPHCKSNVGIVTWVGDIASSAADFVFDYLKNNHTDNTQEAEQFIINTDAPGSDMLGDIEPYVIAANYKVGLEKGKTFTEIITDYYNNTELQKNKFIIYAEMIGLNNFDGNNFANENEWIKNNYRELRDATSFVVYSQCNETIKKYLLPLLIWLGCYKKQLKIEYLLTIFIDSLKNCIKKNK